MRQFIEAATITFRELIDNMDDMLNLSSDVSEIPDEQYYAYIYDEEQSEIDGRPTWWLCNDIEEILSSSMATTYIFNELNSESIDKVIARIALDYPSNNIFRKEFPLLFKNRFQKRYTSRVEHEGQVRSSNSILYLGEDVDEIDFSLLGRYNYHEDILDELVRYVKKMESVEFPYRHQYLINEHKNEFNANGIYVRPVKHYLEYNPVKAKKQAKLVTEAKQRRKENHINIDILNQVSNSMEVLVNRILPIDFRHGSYFEKRSYAITCHRILFYVDCINMLFYGKLYRQLKPFQNLKTHWRGLTEKSKKNKFDKNFIDFMKSELKIKKVPVVSADKIHRKLKPIFSLSKIESLSYKK